MKKITMAILAAVLVTGFAFAGTPDNGANKVSYFSLRSFYTNFGDIPVTQWQSEAGIDKAIFTQDGVVMNAYFSRKGEFIGTTHEMDYTQLPVAAQKLIAKKYGTDTIEKIIDFDDNEASDATLSIFGTTAEDSDNYFVMLRDKNDKNIVLEVSHAGEVSFFTTVK
jgi:hypothetical protein